VNSLDPELVTELKILPVELEKKIKEGFYELRQKFKEHDPQCSIYISHVVLHEHHPVFSKLHIDTVKQLLTESRIISLTEGQVLYTFMQQDANVYFVLFGRVSLYAISDEADPQNPDKNILLGKATLGWCVGEEVLYYEHL